jgi:tripartite-type tricarboxylate transporter receptor subunit TctC
VNTYLTPYLIRFATALAVLLGGGAALAQPYPSKPIKMIVPFAAGGGSDTQGRVAARIMSANLGQPIVVENRPGASGIVGLDSFVRSEQPDGYAMLVFPGTTAIAHHFQNRTFDIDKTLIPMGNLYTAGLVLLVNPAKINVRNMGELIQYLKANPGTDYTSVGPASQGNLTMEAAARRLGLRTTHIPHKGGPPALADVLSGQIGMILIDPLTGAGPATSGRLRMLAALSTKRASFAADVPTAAEQGYPDFTVDSLTGLALPLGTPAPVVARLTAAMREAVADASFQDVVRKGGNVPEYIDGPTFAKMVQEEYERWGRIIRETGIKAP